MQILSHVDAMQALAKATKKHAMFVSFSWSTLQELEEIAKAAPYLCANTSGAGDPQIMVENSAIILFDSEEEMQDAYDRTVGYDGPTKKNPYTGTARVYALTCSPDGECMQENT